MTGGGPDLLALYDSLRAAAAAAAAAGGGEATTVDLPYDHVRAESEAGAQAPGADAGPTGSEERPRDQGLDAVVAAVGGLLGRTVSTAPGQRGSASSPVSPAPPFDVVADAEARRRGALVRGLEWARARRVAARVAGPLAAVTLPLADPALPGAALAGPLTARADLPAFDTAAMDGWAVAGPGPWRLRQDGGTGGGLAGAVPSALPDGWAVPIATGAPVPDGASAVLRREHGHVAPSGRVSPAKPGEGAAVAGPEAAELLYDRGRERLGTGRDIRPRGQECRCGEELLPAGTAVTPAVLGLAASCGNDGLTVHRRPRAELLVLGDELLDAGLPGGGRVRDALGPMLPSWLHGYGAQVSAPRRIGDDLDALTAALCDSTADVVVTTGSTAAGPVDHLHRALAAVDAELLVDGVRVRPGHPMLLARLAGGRWLVGLPGNPLAALAGAATLAEPLLRALAGCPHTAPYRCRTAAPLPGHPHDTRLVPVLLPDRGAVPLAFDGPAMLRGVAVAEGLAVVPPGGLSAGAEVDVLEVP